MHLGLLHFMAATLALRLTYFIDKATAIYRPQYYAPTFHLGLYLILISL